MRHTLAAAVAAAVGEHIFDPVEVRPVGEGEAWVTVQGEVKRGTAIQQFQGMVTEAVVGADEVHLLAADFADAYPKAGWWVRELSGPNAGRVLRLSEPARVADRAGRFLVAPLKPNQDTVPA